MNNKSVIDFSWIYNCMGSSGSFVAVDLSSYPGHRYLRLAHWLHSQQRAVSAREAASFFNVSPWSIERDFSRIRQIPEIIIFDEKLVPSRGGNMYLLRVIHIEPYWLDEEHIPHRLDAEFDTETKPRILWRDLVSRQWNELLRMYQCKA